MEKKLKSNYPPPAVPIPLGLEVTHSKTIRGHGLCAGDGVIMRSRTGFFIFLNNAPVQWFSKRLARVENFVFGSEFIAMRTPGLKTIQGLRYKLRMMGIPFGTPTYFCYL